MIATFLTIIVVFFVVTLAIAWTEATDGYLGDSSMVPGCLGIMAAVLGIVAMFGLLLGQIVIRIN